MFGFVLKANLLKKHSTQQWNICVKYIQKMIEIRIKNLKLPYNTKIHKKEYYFAGEKILKLYIKER